jgi:hypothetical protein
MLVLLGIGLSLSAWPLASHAQVARDTIPALRYDFDVSSGYGRISEGSETSWYGSLILMPELYVGSFGIGLHVDLRLNTATRRIRSEDFDSVRDYLGLLYFVTYGPEDQDSTAYGRFGSIEDASLGYGQFFDRYRNTVRIDDPMRGLVVQVPIDRFQFQAVYNDFVSPGVFGTHGSYYPLGIEPEAGLPQTSVGASLAGDLNNESAWVNPDEPGAPFLLPGSPAADTLQTIAMGVDDGPLFMVGVDAGVRWLETDRFALLTFIEAAKIIEYGVGATIGVRGSGTVDELDLEVQYAQRFLGKEFLPDLFGPSYEAERLQEIGLPISGQTISAINTRRNALAGRQSSGIGHQVQIEADYRNEFETSIGYETIYGVLGSGRFHLDMELNAADIPVSVRLGYDRFNMDTLSDVFVASWQDALYRLGVAYEIIGPVRLGLDVSQSYETVYRDGRAVGREKQNRVSPYIQAVFRF